MIVKKEELHKQRPPFPQGPAQEEGVLRAPCPGAPHAAGPAPAAGARSSQQGRGGGGGVGLYFPPLPFPQRPPRN